MMRLAATTIKPWWPRHLAEAFTIAMVMVFYAATAQASSAIHLAAAIQKTLQHNPQLHQFRYSQQRLVADGESAALKPAYQLGMEIENFAGSGEVGGFDNARVTIALSSAIELGSKRQGRTAVAEARISQLEWQRQAQTLDVLADVTRVFIQLLATQQEIDVAEEAVAMTQQLLEAVDGRAAHGATSDAEVMRTQALLSQSLIQLDNLRHRFEREKISLVRYWGETKPQFTAVEGDLFSFGGDPGFTSLYQRAQSSPAMAVFASELRLKEAQAHLAQTQTRADINWQVGIRHFADTEDHAFTLGVSMPLFAASRNRSSVRASLAERNATELQRDEGLLLLHERLFNAYSQRQQFIDAHRALQHQVIPHLEQALTINRHAYERGALSYQDWVAAQQELLNAKRQLIETASAALLNQALIEQLTAEPLTEDM